ncbi:MAG: arginine--tRNA ligase [Spirochaetes bacterium]|nr:arginine--tRNA ligase [Spirochaetota bacterium]MBN2769639.1 arginine--tRNA ligase [Spirochaetota bacterium]
MKRIKIVIGELVSEALMNAVKDGKFGDCSVSDFPDIKIEYPKEEKFGDYSTPIALESARILKKSPFVIGEILSEYLSDSELIDKIDVVKPGFVNIFVSRKYLVNSVIEAVKQGESFGKSQKQNPLRYSLEFVSANPTGPLNVVSARAAALGDSLANIIEASGDHVDREFYVNDHGNQVNLFGLSVYSRYREILGEKIDFPDDGYQGEYVKDIAQHVFDNKEFNADEFASEEEIISFFSKYAISFVVKSQQVVMEKFRVKYKQWFRESTLHENGIVNQTFDEMVSRGVIYDEEGKKFFRATDYDDDKDRVVVREDGRPTYLMADIAYHENKYTRGYDSIIDIWGPDHHGYIARLRGAMIALGHDSEKFRVLIAQQVNLIMDGEAVKMSKRLGRFSTMQELIDDIGVDAARYFFVARSMDSHLDFDLELAKRRTSENPVFYLQYAHARICSIFREAEKRNINIDECSLNQDHLDNPEALSLLKMIVRFPEEIADAASVFEVHRLANYLLRLAQDFHRFYTVNRILTDDTERTESMLIICTAVKNVIRNGLNILGVSAPDSM